MQGRVSNQLYYNYFFNCSFKKLKQLLFLLFEVSQSRLDLFLVVNLLNHKS